MGSEDCGNWFVCVMCVTLLQACTCLYNYVNVPVGFMLICNSWISLKNQKLELIFDFLQSMQYTAQAQVELTTRYCPGETTCIKVTSIKAFCSYIWK